MYTISTDPNDGVTFTCSHCTFSVRVKEFRPDGGHQRTQAATTMNEHFRIHERSHGEQKTPLPPFRALEVGRDGERRPILRKVNPPAA